MELISEDKCCGCGCCEASCPFGAISMKKNKEGFYLPIIDKEKCRNCGICKKKCPIENLCLSETFNYKYYAGYSKSEDVLKSSSSGGLFYEIAYDFINRGGHVFGATFDRNKGVFHIKISDTKDLKKILKSKYLQSKAYIVFKEIRTLLEQNEKVLFCGTPCQVSALNSFLSKKYDNLYTVDFICTGVPSKLVFDSYIAHYEKKFKKKLEYIDFRDKKSGWYNYNILMKFKNKNVASNRFFDPIMSLHYKQISLMKGCYDCKFRRGKSCSDIQLGDFWNVEVIDKNIYNRNGVSAIIVKSLKGQEIFSNVKNKIEFKEVSEEDLLRTNKSYDEVVFDITKRNAFFSELINSDNKFEVINKYGKVKLKNKIMINKNLLLLKLKNR